MKDKEDREFLISSTYNTPEEAHSAPPKVEILPAGETARNEFGHRYGSQQAMLTKEQIEALLTGQQLAVEIMDGEYVLFLSAENEK